MTERLGLLERSAYKARQLTMQLLTFAKGGSPIKQTASIVEVIRESTEFALRGSNLKPEFDFSPDLAVVEIDTGQMSQVVQNLVINAKHAMPGGGFLRISGKNIKLTERENLPLMCGDYIRVSIEDFGCGISAEDLSKIFDPYFTTKEKGTGLGLATAYSILKRHEGLITVESELGKGSIFHLIFHLRVLQLLLPSQILPFNCAVPAAVEFSPWTTNLASEHCSPRSSNISATIQPPWRTAPRPFANTRPPANRGNLLQPLLWI